MADYLLITGVVIALIAITFLLLIFMPTPNCYYSFDEIGDDLAKFSNEETFNELVKEIDGIDYDANGIRMLYQDGVLHANMNIHPKLYELLRTVPDVKRVFLKQIEKKEKSHKRKGSSKFANTHLRCILPIDISGTKKSGMWVDGETRFYRDRDWIIYDDSRENSYYNKHKRLDVYLLVVDIDRPELIPIGISTEENATIF
jgi:hypothetical protein